MKYEGVELHNVCDVKEMGRNLADVVRGTMAEVLAQ